MREHGAVAVCENAERAQMPPKCTSIRDLGAEAACENGGSKRKLSKRDSVRERVAGSACNNAESAKATKEHPYARTCGRGGMRSCEERAKASKMRLYAGTGGVGADSEKTGNEQKLSKSDPMREQRPVRMLWKRRPPKCDRMRKQVGAEFGNVESEQSLSK